MRHIITLDCGHGGNDPGGRSLGITETEFNWRVGQHAKMLLEKTYNCVVFLTKDAVGDNPSFSQRCAVAHNVGASCLVSIHHNAFKGTTSGYEIIYETDSNASKQLAIEIEKQFALTRNAARGIYTKPSVNYPGNDYFSMLEYGEPIPAVITEFAYMDNVKDYELMANGGGIEKEAEYISNGIAAFLQLESRVIVPTLPDWTNHWGAGAIEWGLNNGIVKGYSNNVFMPDKPATRAEIITMIKNYYDKFK